MRNNYLLAIIVCLVLYACNSKSKRHISRDKSINGSTSFNNLFLDSTDLEKFIGKHPEFKPFEDQYQDFYKERNYEYAWFDSSGLSEQAHNFVNLLNTTMTELQDSSLYNKPFTDLYNSFPKDASAKEKDKLQIELYFTGQFYAYAAKIYKGSDINAAELGWFIPRKKQTLAKLLDSTLLSKNADPNAYSPLNAQYKKLQESLPKYFEIDKQGVWPSIASPAKPFKKKDSSASIVQIKHDLFLLGDMATPDSSAVFDTTLFNAAKHFQRRLGLLVDGVIGSHMIEELNITPKQRIRQILVNMERARWMPPENDTNYILVNIPEYKMHVYDSGRLAFDMNVIVGTQANSTVIFTGNLKYIVFSPYWNVPPSIVQKEVVPGIKKDKNYITKNDMEITGQSKGLPLVRQKPGEKNSLGLVKFLFPNNYDIYFHDTPNRELFSATSRSFSHGCIRLGEPKKFASYLLRSDTTNWKSRTIDSSMHLKTERWVSLKKTLPVFIVYFTAWVNKDGVLNFRKDIYGHDKKMEAKLFTQ